MGSFIPNQRTFKMPRRAVMLLGAGGKQKKKENVCEFWALSPQTSDVSNGIKKKKWDPSRPATVPGSQAATVSRQRKWNTWTNWWTGRRAEGVSDGFRRVALKLHRGEMRRRAGEAT